MVIGAGPAGMEAARIAAQRGHDVTLYGKAAAVGGMLGFAEGLSAEVVCVGDCANPLNIANAIATGNVAARNI